MAGAPRILVQRQPGFRLGSRQHLRLARPELGWLRQQADSTLPVTPQQQQEMSMQRANSLALEEARPKAQVKLHAPL
jgi:hypothetical protein